MQAPRRHNRTHRRVVGCIRHCQARTRRRGQREVRIVIPLRRNRRERNRLRHTQCTKRPCHLWCCCIRNPSRHAPRLGRHDRAGSHRHHADGRSRHRTNTRGARTKGHRQGRKRRRAHRKITRCIHFVDRCCKRKRNRLRPSRFERTGNTRRCRIGHPT